MQIKRDAPSYKRLALSTIVEKPTREFARANLATPGLNPGEYLTAFGLYVISETASLFAHLESQQKVRDSVGPSAGLLHLTPALDAIRSEAGLDGVLLDGERFDIGNDAAHYLSTLNSIAKKEPPGTPRPAKRTRSD
jgi:UTP-glucose-1-phosphate uridylyltransferase